METETKEETLDLLVWNVDDILEIKKKFSVKDNYEQLQFADKTIKTERRDWYESFALTH
jgi:hypothetical protein